MQEIEGYPCPKCGFDISRESQPPFALPWNTILHGRYLIGRVLGQGGFGITYVGWDLLLEIKVAIKEYYPTGQASRQNNSSRLVWHTTGGRAPEGSGGDAFLKEARKMAKISGVPEIVRVLDTFCDNETAYIVMEFVEGETLKTLTEKFGTISFEDCARMFMPLLEGLDKVHAQGLIHRDISPDNLMMQGDGSLRLLDFGAAKDTSIKKSATSQLVAKHGFSPVEQYTGKGIGPWTDVYAICATMYYLVTGELPPEALERLDGDTLDFSKARKAPLTRDQQAILAAGLAVKAEERTQSLGQLAQQLKGTLPPPQPPKPVHKPRPKWDRKKKLIAGGCGLAALIVILCIVLRPGPVEVDVLGCPNASKHGGSLMVEIPDEYIFYDDKDCGLYMSAYDTEDETFYIGTEGEQCLDERALFLNVGQDKIYYIHDGDIDDTLPDAIYQLNPEDGGKVSLIQGDQYMYLQYARLTNGKEYLYYAQLSDDPSGLLFHLLRYDLASRKSEEILEDQICWFNLDGEYLYYTTFEDLRQGTSWKRAFLDGEKPTVLNDSDTLVNGYIEDGTAYMFSATKELLLQFDRDGKSVNSPLPIFDGCSSFGDGWLYYCLTDSEEVRRVLPDGTGDSLVMEGRNITNLCYNINYLWMLEEQEINGETVPVQSLMVYKNGESVLEIDEREEPVLGGLTPGVEYELDGDVLVLTGYTGSEGRVIVPWEVAGVQLSDIRKSDSFPAVDVYAYPLNTELTWEKNEDGSGVILTGYNPDKTKGYPFLVLPAEMEGLPVVEIGEKMFKDNGDLKGMILLSGVQSIGKSAFSGCKELAHVELPGTLKIIGNSAFFSTKALTEIKLPNGLEQVGFDAFWDGGLTSIHIPASVTSLKGNPFSTRYLQELDLEEANSTYTLVDGAIYGDSALKAVPAAKTGTLTVRAGTEDIAQDACAFGSISGLFLSEGVKNIYPFAFSSCVDLSSVTLPDGLETIDDHAFYNCKSLMSITIPRSVTAINSRAFKNCGISSVTVPRDCELASDAFDSGVQINYYE